MPMTLTKLELLALLALAKLGQDAYGVNTRHEIAAMTGRDISMAAVYVALDRLERLGLARAWQSEPRPERGGRSRRQFAITPAGLGALRAERAAMTKMWRGVSLSMAGRRR
jgi:DNA-binding PadR family transcriptional regulator